MGGSRTTSKSPGLRTGCAFTTAAVTFGRARATHLTVPCAEPRDSPAAFFGLVTYEFGVFLTVPTAFGLSAWTGMSSRVLSREFRALVGLGVAPRRNLAKFRHLRGRRVHPVVDPNTQFTRRQTPAQPAAPPLVAALRSPSTRLGMADSVPKPWGLVVTRQGAGPVGAVPREPVRFRLGRLSCMVSARLDRTRGLEGI